MLGGLFFAPLLFAPGAGLKLLPQHSVCVQFIGISRCLGPGSEPPADFPGVRNWGEAVYGSGAPCPVHRLCVRVGVMKQGCPRPGAVAALKSAARGAAAAPALRRGDRYSCDGLRKATVTLPCETSEVRRNVSVCQPPTGQLAPLGAGSSAKYFGVWWGGVHQTGPSGALAGMASAWGGLAARASRATATSLTWLVCRSLKNKCLGREGGGEGRWCF